MDGLNSFQILLQYLDSDEETASEKYLALHSKITKISSWKGCAASEVDEIADTVIDRIAKKIVEGEEIKDVNSYARGVLRFILLERSRKMKEDAVGDDLPEVSVLPEIPDEPELRLRCLRKCLATTVSDESDRRLIIGYYDTDAGEKNKENRKKLAKELNITMTNLKVKAGRLRNRLEKCVNECVKNLSVTDSANSDTLEQGGKKR